MEGRQQTSQLDWIGTISRVTAGVIFVDVSSVRGRLQRRSTLDREILETEKNNKLSARIGLMPRSVSFCPSHSSPAILVRFLWQNAEMVEIERRKYPCQRIISLFEHTYKSPDDLGF